MRFRQTSGFTIVELLIVVIVIGILASIIIVAYVGIQDRAKTVSAQVLANAIQQKAEVFMSTSGAYPENAAEFNSYPESAIDAALITSSLPTTEKSIRYTRCPSNISLPITGAQIIYKKFPGASNYGYITMGSCS